MARGTGRTTAQMKGALRGAVFVWVNHKLSYPRDLARKIGRDDLEIVSPDWLDRLGFAGRDLTDIVVDHAAELRGRQYDLWREALTRVRR